MRLGLLEFIETLPAGITMVEIGCYQGEATEMFLAKAAKLVAVDPWADYIEDTGSEAIGSIHMREMSEVERLFDARVGDRVTKVKLPSIEGAALFEDGSFDLVYIDANHGYADVLADIKAWRPKVKAGGIFAGHDFNDERPYLQRAVREAVGEPEHVFPDSTWVVRA
jgi:predicted O-methyltransferase YrrM